MAAVENELMHGTIFRTCIRQVGVTACVGQRASFSLPRLSPRSSLPPSPLPALSVSLSPPPLPPFLSTSISTHTHTFHPSPPPRPSQHFDVPGMLSLGSNVHFMEALA